MTFAYSQALAGESVEFPNYYDVLTNKFVSKYDPEHDVFNHVTHADLERFARIVAYKVAHNLKLGYKMDPKDDPLTYIDCDN